MCPCFHFIYATRYRGKIERALAHADENVLPHADIDGSDFLGDPV